MTETRQVTEFTTNSDHGCSDGYLKKAVNGLLNDIERCTSEADVRKALLSGLRSFAAENDAELTARFTAQIRTLESRADSNRREAEDRSNKIRATEEDLARAYDTIEQLKSVVDEIQTSTTWRAIGPLRIIGTKLPTPIRKFIRRVLRLVSRCLRYFFGRKIVKQLESPNTNEILDNVVEILDSRDPYDRWVRNFDTLSDNDRREIKAHLERLAYKPLISVVMPTYETPQALLLEAIESVRGQLYTNWELCIADDASSAPHIAAILTKASAEDTRIKWVKREKNGHISAASNSALAIATGEFVALMDHDDLLPAHALYEIALEVNRNPQLDVIFSDEDQIDSDGKRQMPYFKTDWNSDLILAHNMVSHLGVYRRTLLESVGGFREGFEGSQDYDVTLRCVDATTTERISHIPAVLYHWRRNYGVESFSESNLQICSNAALRAISDHLARRQEKGIVEPHPVLPQWTRVIREVPIPQPLVSLIIPTRDRADLLGQCVEGILNRTNYSNFEVIIVDHASELPETIALFEKLKLDSRVRVLPYQGQFNYSAINNMAVSHAKGSIVGLINNDIDVINADWLAEMVSLVSLKEVGAVGAKLLYPDDRVQHGGVVLGVGGVANHFNYSAHKSDIGYFGRNVLTSTVSAVTGACLLIRKSVFEEVGGLNERDLAIAFNDVDFCLRVRQKGYRNVWTPHAELYHHESASRGSDDTPAKRARFLSEVAYMQTTWEAELKHDPFYSDNFSADISGMFSFASPPRRAKPWVTQ